MVAQSNVLPLKRTSPNTENGKVLPPRRLHNAERRSREHLTPDEVAQVIKAAGHVGRHAHRDATLIRLAFRHGFRVSELVAVRWDQIDLKQGLLHVNRLKNGVPSTHPLRGPELRALRQLQREYPGPYVFATERGGPMTPATVRKMISRTGELAQLPFPIHRTCFDTRAATSWRTMDTTRERCSTTSATRTFSTQCVTRNWALDRFKAFWKD